MTLGPDIASSWGNVKGNFYFMWISYYLPYSHAILLHWPAQFLWTPGSSPSPVISNFTSFPRAESKFRALDTKTEGKLAYVTILSIFERNKPQSVLTSHHTFIDIFIHSTNIFDHLPHWDSHVNAMGPASKLLSHRTDRNKPRSCI